MTATCVGPQIEFCVRPQWGFVHYMYMHYVYYMYILTCIGTDTDMNSSSDGAGQSGQQQSVPQHSQGGNRLVSDFAREQTIVTESETSDATAVRQCYVKTY